MASRRFAAIDIGTVTTRLLVAEVSGVGASSETIANGTEGMAPTLTVLARGYRITNLGEGVDASSRLRDDAIGRVVAAIRDFCATRDGFCDKANPTIPTVCVATSAARDASNADDLASQLATLGITAQVIPGEREAALSFQGATMGQAGCAGRPAIVVDIGGGSTEVIAGIGGEAPLFAHSFDIGCRRVTERFLTDDPPTSAQMEAAQSWMQAEMEPELARLSSCGNDAHFLADAQLLAVAGTATSVVSIREAMAVYDSDRVHGALVTRHDVEALLDQLASLPLSERRQVVGLDPDRADVMVAGALILQTVMRQLEKETYTASESDILQGLIWNAAGVVP